MSKKHHEQSSYVGLRLIALETTNASIEKGGV